MLWGQSVLALKNFIFRGLFTSELKILVFHFDILKGEEISEGRAKRVYGLWCFF